MLGIRCSKHLLYNGAKEYSDPCDACAVIHAVNILTQHVPSLERIQPIKIVDLASASTASLLGEIAKRIGE